MALMDEIKNCKVCSKTFSPKKGVSRRQWARSLWCSRACFNSTRLGVPLKDSHKTAIGKGGVGRVFTEETKQKIALANTGKIRTLSVRQKLRSAHLKGGHINKEGRLIHRIYGQTKNNARLVAATYLGRELLSREIVHHIDGDTLNDDVKNLFLFRRGSAHTRWHGYLRRNKLSGTILKSNLGLLAGASMQ